jgi:hypothetical protein
MAKTPEREEIMVKPDLSKWVERLGSVLLSLENMEKDERHAALKYIKSVYSQEWPPDNY